MNGLPSVALALSALMVAGCAAPPRIFHSRAAPTGIEVGEAIAVELERVARPDGNDAVTEADQEMISTCIGRAMREANPRLVLAKTGVTGIRYLVRVDVRTVHSEPKPTFALGGMPGMWGAGEKWRKTSHFRAEVFDVKNGRVAGNLGAYAHGEEERGALMFLVIPFFPIFSWSNTEKTACHALGKELARFVEGP
jgi:hypothetical protein